MFCNMVAIIICMRSINISLYCISLPLILTSIMSKYMALFDKSREFGILPKT